MMPMRRGLLRKNARRAVARARRRSRKKVALWFWGAIGCLLASGSRPAQARTVWPGEVRRIASTLRGDDPPQGQALQQVLSRMPSGALARLLPELLDSPRPDLQLAAARAALGRDFPGSARALQHWLRHPQAEFRRLAVRALERQPAPRQIRTLARLLSDEDETLRRLAARALGTSLAPEAVALLLPHLTDSSAAVRAEVVWSLSLLDPAQGLSTFTASLNDEDAAVRQAAIAAVGAVGDARGARGLSRALSDPSLEVRQIAARALAQLGPAVAVEPLLALLGPNTHPTVQRSAIAGLIDLGAAASVVRAREELVLPEATVLQLFAQKNEALADALERCATDPATSSMTLCLAALGYQRHTDARQAALAAALGRGAPEQIASLEALGRMGSGPASLAVAALLRAEAPRVRATAVRTLDALLQRPQAPGGLLVEPILDALSQPELGTNERARLVRLLGRTASPRALAPVLSATRSHAAPVRASAAEALGALEAGVEPLLQLLRDESRRVRWSAALALRAGGNDSAVEGLLDSLGSPGELSSLSALAAVGPLHRAAAKEHVNRLVALLDGAAPPQLDGVIEGLAVARGGQGVQALRDLAQTAKDEATLAKIAESLGTQLGSGSVLEQLAQSPRPWVRAQAVSSLGWQRPQRHARLLEERLTDRALSVVVNASAALARALPAGEPLPAAWCSLLDHPFAAVRGNAVAALRNHAVACQPLPQLLQLLLVDDSERVRWLTAQVLAGSDGLRPSAAFARRVRGAMRLCERREASPRVAQACSAAATRAGSHSEPPLPLPEAAPSTLLVLPTGEDRPMPGALFVLEGPDHFVRIGRSDRRGATLSPAGERPAQLLALEAL